MAHVRDDYTVEQELADEEFYRLMNEAGECEVEIIEELSEGDETDEFVLDEEFWT